jgi:ribonuclease HI
MLWSKGWLFGWEKKGFAKKKNPDLWKRFLKCTASTR